MGQFRTGIDKLRVENVAYSQRRVSIIRKGLKTGASKGGPGCRRVLQETSRVYNGICASEVRTVGHRPMK